jgi:hypothetical protein
MNINLEVEWWMFNSNVDWIWVSLLLGSIISIVNNEIAFRSKFISFIFFKCSV